MNRWNPLTEKTLFFWRHACAGWLLAACLLGARAAAQESATPTPFHDPYMESLLKEAFGPASAPTPTAAPTETPIGVWRVSDRRRTPAPTLVFPPVAGERAPQATPERGIGETPEPLETLEAPAARKTPSADAIVAVVNRRRLPRERIQRRVENILRLRGLQPGTEDFEDAARRFESFLVDDWIRQSLLAEESLARGFTITEEEVNQRIEELKKLPEAVSDLEGAMSAIGLTEEELRAEVRNGLLAEKLISAETQIYNNDDYLRPRYERAPHFYFRPAQKRVWHYTQTLTGYESAEEMRRWKSRMEQIRKRLAAGEAPAALALAEGGPEKGAVGLDLGWVTPGFSGFSNRIQTQGRQGADLKAPAAGADTVFPPEADRALAKLKTGQVSDVILVTDSSGQPREFHLLKVTDERPAIGETYESARPILEESLHEAIREWLLGKLRKSGKHYLAVNLSGVDEEDLSPHPPASSAAPAAAPNPLELTPP